MSVSDTVTTLIGCQPNLAVLNRWRHLYSAGRPSRWALAHILVSRYFAAMWSHCVRTAMAYCGSSSLLIKISKLQLISTYNFQSGFCSLWAPCGIGQAIIFSCCGFYLLLLSFFPSPNLSGRRLDVYHTSTHGVALVQI